MVNKSPNLPPGLPRRRQHQHLPHEKQGRVHQVERSKGQVIRAAVLVPAGKGMIKTEHLHS